MHALAEQFLDYLILERGLSDNTREAYAQDLRAFLPWLAGHNIRGLNDVAREDILDFLMAEKDRGLNVNSLARRLVAIKVFFRYLRQENLLAANVTDAMDSPRLWKILPGFLTYRETEALLNAPDIDHRLGVRDKALLETLYGTGLRVSELTSLTLDDLHFDTGYVRCMGKGRKERIVPLGGTARRWLTRYLEEVRPGLAMNTQERGVFLTCRKKPFSRKTIWKMIKQYARRAGIEKNVYPHTLRHSFASHMLANEAPLRVIQEMLGHADIATTQIYTHIDSSRLKAVHHQFHPRA